jgi:hypothetical protein
MVSYLRRMTRDPHSSLYILLSYVFEPDYRVGFGHLEDVLVDGRYVMAGDIMKYLGQRARALGRGEIIALSGNSGMGPSEFGWVQPPHLHFALYRWNEAKRSVEDLDPEKYGVDGGRPVFWDGRALLDARSTDRPALLEKSLMDFGEKLRNWGEGEGLEEPRGVLTEYSHLIGKTNGREILNSKHFHDMRSYLRKITLEDGRFTPGTGPYRLMLEILGYSTDEKQKVILSLPFIAQGLERMYKRPVYENGSFFTIESVQE